MATSNRSWAFGQQQQCITLLSLEWKSERGILTQISAANMDVARFWETKYRRLQTHTHTGSLLLLTTTHYTLLVGLVLVHTTLAAGDATKTHYVVIHCKMMTLTLYLHSNFSDGLHKTFFATAFWLLKVIQGHWFWYRTKSIESAYATSY